MSCQTQKITIPYFTNADGFCYPLTNFRVPENGVVTLYQCNAGYNPVYDVHTDCMLAYVYGINNGGALDSWVKHKHTYNDNTVIGLMVAINRDSGEYVEEYAGERGLMDVQTRADGTFRQHSTMGPHNIYYMVPTEPYVEYKWKVLQHFLDTGHVKVVTFEEPELWNDAGYSKGFQEEWEKFYGFAYQRQEESATARYRSQYLKAYLFYDAVRKLAQRVKANYPDVQVILPTHSIDDYCAHGIATNLSMFASVDEVDGFIGQTWSDGVVRPLPFAGEECENPFATAVTQYRSYRPFLKPEHGLYLLQDPASDNPTLTQPEKEERWKKTVVASMMQDDSVVSQFTIWPQRAFSAASRDYRSIQLNVYKMYYEMATLKGNIYAGSSGIGFGLSDTASWCIGENHQVTAKNLATIFGVSMQLIEDCILPDIIALDMLTDVKQLSHMRVLLVSYDAMKPLNEQIQQVLADWVKQGGRLLVVGCDDDYTHMEDAWWTKKGTTPAEDLLDRLGVIAKRASVGVDSVVPAFNGKAMADSCAIPSDYAKRTITYVGDEITPFITVNDDMIGFTATVGDGRIGVLGLPSAYFALSRETANWLRELWKLMLEGDTEGYVPADTLAVVRGGYVALWGSKDLTLNPEKIYLDLFDYEMKPLQGGTLAKGLTAFYYDVTDAVNAGKPALLFTGGVETAERVATENSVQFTIAHPSDSYSSSMVFNGGKKLASVQAISASGILANIVEKAYDEQDMVLLKIDAVDVADPVTVTVTWEE
ncbi:MAG: hypothetical protein IKM39_01585 [Clostridia bacterium]|nr:hypothetical protein [Clostridia bacterium]